jgi:hypothetical protein
MLIQSGRTVPLKNVFFTLLREISYKRSKTRREEDNLVETTEVEGSRTRTLRRLAQLAKRWEGMIGTVTEVGIRQAVPAVLD